MAVAQLWCLLGCHRSPWHGDIDIALVTHSSCHAMSQRYQGRVTQYTRQEEEMLRSEHYLTWSEKIEDWLRMNCLLFERCKCLYGVWCGKELRRDEGLEPMTEVWVWGSGMLIRGCKPQMRWRTMFIPWCQHPRQGARRSPASCSEAAVRCCRGNPGSAVSRSAVSHGTTARTADTITGSVSLKPCSGMK